MKRAHAKPWMSSVCWILLAGCATAREPAEPAQPKVLTPVRVRVVEESGQSAGARYSGTLEPATRVELAFKVGGYVQEIAQVKSGGQLRKVQEGDFVSKGTVLAVVRESDYQQKLDAANAGMAEAVAQQHQTQLDFDRTQKLAASSAASQMDVDNQRARLETSSARVDSAKSHILEAQLALTDCTLRAPIDGVLLKRPIEVGSLVGPGTLGFVIADTKSVKVLFGAPDRLVEKLKPGGKVAVGFDTVAGTFAGTISRIAPSADLKSRAFEVEATIPNPNNQLHVGMIAKLVIPDAELKNSALVLPLTAVVRSRNDARGFSVFVVDDDHGKAVAHLRDVKLGDLVGSAVIVSAGLKAAERVVSMGATLLTDGEPVRVIPN
jgi:RND family efflux transporter MFP subunit